MPTPTPPWLAARWRAFLGSFDADEISSLSSPISTVMAAGSLALVFLIVGEVPMLREASGARATLPCAVLALLGGSLTLLAYRERCRGTLGSIATLFDNGCYALALGLEAITTRRGFGIGFAVVQALVMLAFPASAYGFSLLMWLVLCGPTLLLVTWSLWHGPDVTVTLVLIAASLMTGLLMTHTSRRRELLAGAKRLEQALGATNQVLDMAMQRALGTTLLGLGNFLHELRNLQSAVRMNLEALQAEKLAADQAEAVADALKAARSQEGLLEETLEELRRQSQPRAGGVMNASDVLGRALRLPAHGLSINYQNAAPVFEVHGEAAHLSSVLRNLLRNAAQAGATRVTVTAALDAGAHTLAITVTDDGPGIPSERIERLFQPFVSEGKLGGTGLGLYLSRRYIELMGGEIKLESPPGKGAKFTIRLPGKVLQAAEAPLGLPQTAASAS